MCRERKHDKKIYCHSECSYYCTQVDTDPGKPCKSWNFCDIVQDWKVSGKGYWPRKVLEISLTQVKSMKCMADCAGGELTLES